MKGSSEWSSCRHLVWGPPFMVLLFGVGVYLTLGEAAVRPYRLVFLAFIPVGAMGGLTAARISRS